MTGKWIPRLILAGAGAVAFAGCTSVPMKLGEEQPPQPTVRVLYFSDLNRAHLDEVRAYAFIATLEQSIAALPQGFHAVEVLPQPGPRHEDALETMRQGWPIVIMKDGTEVLRLSARGGTNSVFVVAGKTLYFAGYSRGAPGCWITAYDLSGTGKLLWRCQVGTPNLGPNSLYVNRVALALRGDRLYVHGQESAGEYFTVLGINPATVPVTPCSGRL